MKHFITLVFWGFLIPSGIYAQMDRSTINPALFKEKWPAKWITHPTASKLEYGVFHFRRNFRLNEVPDHFIVHVSADNRYKLYVNGQQVCLGPAMGDLLHWRFESVDISPWLTEGQNVLSALVWNYGEQRPLHQMSFKTALIVQGNGAIESIVNTAVARWKVMQNKGYYPIHMDWRNIGPFYYASVPGDSVVGGQFPWGWNEVGHESEEWLQPVLIGYGSQGVMPGYHYFTGSGAWKLVPRQIPPMEARNQRFQKVVRTDGIEVGRGFLEGNTSVTVPAHRRLSILIDQAKLTRAYPVLKLSGGEGGSVKVTYAEALFDENFRKGNRDSIAGKHIVGFYDVFLPDSDKSRIYTTLWHRVFRYVALDIVTEEEPLILEDFYSVFSGYPFDLEASFKSSDSELNQVFETGYRTLQVGTGEVFEDGPYYEQLMYAGDARIESMLAMYLTSDDRMTRRMIDLFDGSRISEGLTYARYPSNVPQINPQYSLAWIQGIYDHFMIGGDPSFAWAYLDGIADVLEWHERLIDSTGMLGEVPWLRHIEAKSGTPKHPERGHSAQQTLFFALTLDQAAKIFEYFGASEKAQHYVALSERLKVATRRWCYDRERGLLADTPEKDVFTQHANTLGILTGLYSEEEQQPVMRKILKDTSLVQGFLFFKSYIFEALYQSGLGELYIDQLGPWREFLRYGLTTFPEFEVESRSDCHAWSAHPSYGMLTTVCGIRSLEPGFRKILIDPHPNNLEHVECRVLHPAGEIVVKLKQIDHWQYEVDIEIPGDVEGLLKWKDQEYGLRDSTYHGLLEL